MNRKSNGKARKLFLIAANLKAEDRAEFLTRVCGKDPGLRSEVELLLESEETDSPDLPETGLAAESGDNTQNSSENEPTKILTGHPSIPPGTQIKRYRIIALIGKGGMGDVYLADDLSLDRKVALKILYKELAEDQERLKRFIHEAKAASSLNHPNIITVHEIDSFEEYKYIVSEFVEGRTLGKVISETELSFRETIEIAKQIASALFAAHKAGIIHRDIKPENVMQRNDGLIKVLDFGLAKTTFRTGGSKVDSEGNTREKISTIPGMVMGTPHYMSPEQARGKTLDHRTDIFSFGVLLYELLTGHLPFHGENGVATVAAIIHKEPEPIENHLNDLPAELVELVAKTLRKKKEERHADMGEVLEDLDALLDDLPTISKRYHRTGGRGARSTAKNTARIWIAGHLTTFVAPMGLLAIIAFSIFGWWFLDSDRGASTDYLSGPLETIEITNWPSAAGELLSTGTFSPDGKLIAYGSTKSGKLSIWVAQTKSGEAINVTEDQFYDRFPIWSPTGEELAFYSTRGGKAGIWRVSALGGQLRQIAQIKDFESRPRKWSQKGTIFYQGRYNLFSLDPGTGVSKQVTAFVEKGVPPKVIQVSPDESRLAVAVKEGKEWRLGIQPIEGGGIIEIARSAEPITEVIWHPDGRHLYFTKIIDDVHQIFRTDTQGSDAVLVSDSKIDSHVNDISSDGRKLLFSSATENSDIWKVDVASAKNSILTSESDSEMWADVSPDNREITYQSIKHLSRGNALTSGSIMVGSVDGSRRPRLLSNGFLPQWSPNGQSVAYFRREGGDYEIWVTDRNGGRPKLLTKNGVQGVEYSMTPYNQTQPKHVSWSPDGNSLAYPAMISNVINIRIVDADGRSDRNLTRNNDSNLRLLCPVWSADGEFAAFASKTRARNKNGDRVFGVWSHEIATGSSKLLISANEEVRLLGFSGTRTVVVAYTKPAKEFTQIPSEVDIYELSVTGNGKRLLRKLRDVYFFNIHLSKDSRSLAFVARSENKDEIRVGSLAGGDSRKLVATDDPRVFFSSLVWSPDAKSIIYDRQTRFSQLLLLTAGSEKELAR